MQRQGTGELTSGPSNSILCPPATPSPNKQLRKPFWAQWAELGPRWKGGYPAPPTQGSISIFHFKHNHRGLFGGRGGKQRRGRREKGSVLEAQPYQGHFSAQRLSCGSLDQVTHSSDTGVLPVCWAGLRDLASTMKTYSGSHFSPGPSALGFLFPDLG